MNIPAESKPIGTPKLKSLELHNFRNLSATKIDALSRVNLITGVNNAGKTSLLEAIYFLLADSQQLQGFPSAFRDSQSPGHERFKHFWLWLLPGRDIAQSAQVQADLSTGGKATVHLALDTSKTRPEQTLEITRGVSFNQEQGRVFVFEDGRIHEASDGGSIAKVSVFAPKAKDPTLEAERYNSVVVMRGGEDRILRLLQVIEPRLEKIRYAKVTSQPLIYADVGMERMIPTSQMGQAFERLLTLYIDMLTSHADVLLIDEIENGLHHTVYKSVWEGIASLACDANIQVFASTHSRECVEAAHQASRRGSDHGFSHHRLMIEQGKLVVHSSSEIHGLVI